MRTTPRRSHRSSADRTSTAAPRNSRRCAVAASAAARVARLQRWVDGRSFMRAGHLIADIPARDRRLIGHLDTVFEPSSPFQKYIKLNDSTATGPGGDRMASAGDAVPCAARTGGDAGQPREDDRRVRRRWRGRGASASVTRRCALVDAAAGASAAMGFEDGAGDPKVASSRRSATEWKLVTTDIPVMRRRSSTTTSVRARSSKCRAS